MADTTETDAVAALAEQAAGKIIVSRDERQFLIVPDGVTWEEITDPHDLLPPPLRIHQKVRLQTVDSLVDYVNRFKVEPTVLFADIETNLIGAVLDYHAPDSPSNTDHTAGLQLMYSEEWKTWAGISGKMMGQLEFARFIEENAADIDKPTGADLLEVVRDLQATRKVDFTKAVRTATDNENFEFSDTTETKSSRGSVEVPARFELAIPVYFGEGSTRLDAFLRWRLHESSLTLGIVLHRAEHVRQAVFKDIVDMASSRVGRPAYYGKPLPPLP